MIRLLNEQDYDMWLELAEEVEHLFGPMVHSQDFCDAIKECLRSSDAYGIEDKTARLVGILAVNRQSNEISWLAVTKKSRGQKFGEKLIRKAIEELQGHGDIFVQTFADGVDEGASARVLYKRHGFEDLKNAGQNPAGIETVIMVRKS